MEGFGFKGSGKVSRRRVLSLQVFQTTFRVVRVYLKPPPLRRVSLPLFMTGYAFGFLKYFPLLGL